MQTSFATTLAFITSLASTKTTIPGLNLQIRPRGNDDRFRHPHRQRRLAPSPFRVTATITGGTDQFAGATGNITIQGTSFSLASSQLRGNLRGRIVTTHVKPRADSIGW